MVDTGFAVAEDDVERFAACYRPGTVGEPRLVVEDRPDASSRYTQPRTYLSGAGGMVSTASDSMRFCTMLTNGGALDGRRIIGPRTLAYMACNHLPGGRDLAQMSPASAGGSCTCPMRINIAGSPVDRQRVKKFYARGLSWPPSGPFTPGDALKTSRADTPTPRQLTATRRSLSCALFLTPPRVVATAARERAAPRVGSRHGPSIPPPSPASEAP